MSSILSAEELAALRPAMARLEHRRKEAAHQVQRAAGRVPDMSLARWERVQAQAAEGARSAAQVLGLALSHGASAAERLDAAREAVRALPVELERLASAPSPRWHKGARSTLGELARTVKRALEELPPGPPPCAFGDPSRYVQEEDLEDIIPDGWGRGWGITFVRLARAHELPPLAFPLLCLLAWASEVRQPDAQDARQRGAGLQVSLGWLARKLGCSPAWVKRLLNRLDPHAAWRREVALVRRENVRRARRGRGKLPEPRRPRGTVYVQRFRRLVRFGAQATRQARPDAWVDKSGKPRLWVDVRGVCYLTDAGRELLGAFRVVVPAGRHPARLERTNLAPLDDLRFRGLGVKWRLEARLDACGKPAPPGSRGRRSKARAPHTE